MFEIEFKGETSHFYFMRMCKCITWLFFYRYTVDDTNKTQRYKIQSLVRLKIV